MLRLKPSANANESAGRPRMKSGEPPKHVEWQTSCGLIWRLYRDARNATESCRFCSSEALQRAQERHEDFGLVLTKYGLERFLYRLAHSQYRDQFVLKGALLFEL